MMRIVFFDVFCKLREDDIEGAKKSIDVFIAVQQPIEELTVQQVETIAAGDNFLDMADLPPELFEHFVKTASYQKWMLFMHPEQRKIVERNFNGAAKLVGVSGSGKTCIIVKRAVYLAEQYPDQKILVLTLNPSLANLIKTLMNYVCMDGIRSRIEVYSFWKFCQQQLLNYEPGNEKLYSDISWKLNEHVDEVWDEFFECHNNNHDAKVLAPVNKSLLVRNIFPKDYIRQEFDWIRSAFSEKERKEYLDIDREGRSEAFTQDFRKYILKGLKAWENMMEFVGVTDYIGLSNALYQYVKRLKPHYRCVLVDEIQDFGTLELKIIRRLVAEQENDLFLCGDVAQQVYSKHHKLAQAGISVAGRSLAIRKNYRNSREILSAAHAILRKNVDFEQLRSDDFEILEPEYANFSSPRPLILKADSLDAEFGSCYNYLKKSLNPHEKACIALCGYSVNDLKAIGERLGLPVLDGDISIDNSNIFLSDLEQTKGFEFDTMAIINCNDHVIPNPLSPPAEWYREICKFYVAMTRAKLQLIVSYSDIKSDLLTDCEDSFISAEWAEHEEMSLIDKFAIPSPMRVSHEQDAAILSMTGEEFLYTKRAVGISRELADKMTSLIAGQSVSRNSRPTEWKNIGAALKERDVQIAQLFGAAKTYPEFKSLFVDI